ncbi:MULTISPECIES: cytochrome-c peroxidase [unclassified Methylophaga]|jgi:cytochrome c peroxidase|uniref:cytochrome-c peroxidase n=2 Tax=Methylophaga TaxID=40222 RepID=UPI0025FD297C|nr:MULTISPECIES: cytochrome-c peroxidase [unclassified Methylophaga]|tara:strand:+ start:14558 stop:15556 length:999 start_codon:yes stop_codon:yes gene_type:complete
MHKILLVGLFSMLNISPVMADRLANEPIKPIQTFIITEPDKVELGKKLFFDPRLSRSGFISCNSCHNLSMGGSDNLPTSIGHNWQQGPINSPTVLNSSMNLAQFWDGRAADLQEQAAGPIANPMEMAFSHSLAIDVLRSIPQYVAEFNKIYGSDDITLDQVTNAIAAFEETLVTPNSRFDLWLKGNDNALTDTEIAGYQKFKQIGCVACHNGEAVGGSSFQRMGIMEPYQTENPAEGRIAVTGKDADRFSFKVPTLRNVELTYPYFHDGAYWKLEDAVDVMARLQLGQELEEQDIKNITAFLKTLTGDQPQFAIPQLPPSTANTPVPVPFEN